MEPHSECPPGHKFGLPGICDHQAVAQGGSLHEALAHEGRLARCALQPGQRVGRAGSPRMQHQQGCTHARAGQQVLQAPPGLCSGEEDQEVGGCNSGCQA